MTNLMISYMLILYHLQDQNTSCIYCSSVDMIESGGSVPWKDIALRCYKESAWLLKNQKIKVAYKKEVVAVAWYTSWYSLHWTVYTDIQHGIAVIKENTYRDTQPVHQCYKGTNSHSLKSYAYIHADTWYTQNHDYSTLEYLTYQQ